jgi:hypothetical protein
MGIPTLISTATSSNVASVSITSGIDSTYDEYMFVFTDIGPATDTADFSFQMNVDGGADYNETITSTWFSAEHEEADANPYLSYRSGEDQAQGTNFQILADSVGNGSDESCAGILHLFSPSSTTYVKHFYSRMAVYRSTDNQRQEYAAGYFNLTGAVDEIQFKMSSGNFDGVIQMYGIA